MAASLLVELYRQLPPHDEDHRPRPQRRRAALTAFKRRVAERYTEGTLQRLLADDDAEARQAAVLALGLIGTMTSNESLAAGLHDDDDEVRQLAVEALWQVWFRADGEDSARELRRLAHVTDRARLLAGLDELIARSPAFAEAYNQRAILFFQMHQPERAVADCEMVLALNPYHFGAQVGMARCLLQQGRRRAALRAFRRARRLHPGLEGVDEIIRNLEAALGEDDKK